MTVFLLQRINQEEPKWDCHNGHVIVADSVQRARTIAAQDAGDEGAAVWLNPKCSTCEPVGTPLLWEERTLLSDFLAG